MGHIFFNRNNERLIGLVVDVLLLDGLHFHAEVSGPSGIEETFLALGFFLELLLGRADTGDHFDLFLVRENILDQLHDIFASDEESYVVGDLLGEINDSGIFILEKFNKSLHDHLEGGSLELYE